MMTSSNIGRRTGFDGSDERGRSGGEDTTDLEVMVATEVTDATEVMEVAEATETKGRPFGAWALEGGFIKGS